MFQNYDLVRDCCLEALSLICAAKRNLKILHWRAKGEEFSIYHGLTEEWLEELQEITDEFVEVADGADIFLDSILALQKSLESPHSIQDEKHVDARRTLQNSCHAIENADLQITCAVVELDNLDMIEVPQSLKAGLDAVSEKLGLLCYQLKRASAV